MGNLLMRFWRMSLILANELHVMSRGNIDIDSRQSWDFSGESESI
jgi:hypothetical protein